MDIPLLSEIAKSGLGFAIAAYVFTLLIKEKDKRIQDAQTINAQDKRLLRDIRKLVNTIERKAKHEVV